MTNDELYELVPVGRENARPLMYFKDATGLSGRQVREKFLALAMSDKIVCNHRGGYFIADNPDDLLVESRILNSYICKLLKRKYRVDKERERFYMRKMEI
jgi:hypothetical protein